MQLDGRLVIVPLWLRDAVKQLGLPIASLINLNELTKHFSGDDIISYHGVNKLFRELEYQSGSPQTEQRFECYAGLFKNIDLMQHAKSLVDEDNYNSTSEVKLLSGIEEGALVFLKEADGMNTLFNIVTTTASSTPASLNPNVYVINLFHIENETFGLTLKPYDGVATDCELAALDDNMELLLTHYKYEDVCQTPLFHRWCFKIKKNQQ